MCSPTSTTPLIVTANDYNVSDSAWRDSEDGSEEEAAQAARALQLCKAGREEQQER